MKKSGHRPIPTRLEMVRAWERRDASYDGVFVFGVKTTGIYCKPSCPSRPSVEHLEFFATSSEALAAGYRSCKRCSPDALAAEPDWVSQSRGLPPGELSKCFGGTPGQFTSGGLVRVRTLSTPLGNMLAAATDRAIGWLEFVDAGTLLGLRARIEKRFRVPVVEGDSPWIDALSKQLDRFFDGKLTRFDVPIDSRGTEFQLKVWEALREIPFGQTRSYADIGRAVGHPRAVRAIARANGSNGIYLLIPCHRVIASDGSLSGYGGGVWRKRLLLALEQRVLGPSRL